MEQGGRKGFSVLNANLGFYNVIQNPDIFKRVEGNAGSSFSSLRSHVCKTSFLFSTAGIQRLVGINHPKSHKSGISAPGC